MDKNLGHFGHVGETMVVSLEAIVGDMGELRPVYS